MIDMMMSTEPEVALFLERLTGGPIGDDDLHEDESIDLFFAMAGAQGGGQPQGRPAR